MKLLFLFFYLSLSTHTHTHTHTHTVIGFTGDSVVKTPLVNAGKMSSSPGLGRSPGEGNDYPLQ